MEQDRVLAQKPVADTHEQRVAEFRRLREMGVKGVKIDFFGGDGQSMIAYYVGILRDAADAGLLVNFHGATLPRGWTRTWPNLMTMPKRCAGFEFTTFEQADQDKMPTPRGHAAVHAQPVRSRWTSRRWCLAISRRSSAPARNGFELATSVLFLSGIQHFAETRPAWPPCPTTSSSSCKRCRAAGTTAGWSTAIRASTRHRAPGRRYMVHRRHQRGRCRQNTDAGPVLRRQWAR
jgi:hypothetical protein